MDGLYLEDIVDVLLTSFDEVVIKQSKALKNRFSVCRREGGMSHDILLYDTYECRIDLLNNTDEKAIKALQEAFI